jgi:Tol biopolymer transport system component
MCGSPDGRRLAYASANGTLSITGLSRSPSDTRVLSAVDAARGVVQWSPDGRWIAFSRSGQGLVIARSDANTIDWVLDDRGSGPRWRPARGE